VEEAQTVLAPSATSAEDSPFVSWVKEGRKYGRGAVLVTQQPGSIPSELLSQGHGVFWSSAPGTDRSARPYPLPVRVLSFEAEHREPRDPSYSLGPVDCYAARLRGRFRGALAAAASAAVTPAGGVDAEAAYRKAAISALLEILGPEGSGWRTEKRPHPERPGASATWILLTETVEDVEHATPPEEQP
jgi:hypothetical protein